jgi:hypothetical protein
MGTPRAASNNMQCNICGGDRFRLSEYRTAAGSAPVLECTECHVFVFDYTATRWRACAGRRVSFEENRSSSKIGPTTSSSEHELSLKASSISLLDLN